MQTGVHYTGSLPPRETRRIAATSFDRGLHIIWTVVPTTPVGSPGTPQVEWDVAVDTPGLQKADYIVSVRNLTADTVTYELRYAILN